MVAPEAGRAGGRARELRRQISVNQPWAPVSLPQVQIAGPGCPLHTLTP